MTELLVRSALITGAAGQDGILLADLLHDQGYDVWVLVRPAARRLSELQQRVPAVRVLRGDVEDKASIAAALTAARPDEVYNLAAMSSVGQSWRLVEDVMRINTMGVLNMLECIRAYQGDTGRSLRYYQASSSEMFGTPEESPQRETTAFHPRSPYAVSKCAAHFLTINYRESYGMFAACGILYNHESVLREERFVTRKITRGVAGIATGRATQLALGSLEVSRDWGYAPDYVRAMWLMLQEDEPSDYVVATGKSRTLEDFLSAAFASAGISDWGHLVVLDNDFIRPSEVAGLVGDPSRANTQLGWAPTVSFEEMISLMVAHDLRDLGELV